MAGGINAATIRLLAEKGLSALDIAEVAAALEKRSDPTNAERQARHRAKRDSNAVTVTRDPPNEYISNPPAETNVSSDSKKPTKKVGKAGALIVQLPKTIPAEPWVEFVAHRKAMRGIPFTEAAAKGVIDKIEGLMGLGHCPTKLLRKAVMHGWRTVFDGEDTKANVTASGRPWTPDEQAAYLAKMNRESTGPPRPIGKFVGGVVSRAGVPGNG